jgi:hypothetical protein
MSLNKNYKFDNQHVNLIGIKPLTNINENSDLLDLYDSNLLTDDNDDKVDITENLSDDLIQNFISSSEKHLTDVKEKKEIQVEKNTLNLNTNSFYNDNTTNVNRDLNYSGINNTTEVNHIEPKLYSNNVDVSSIGIKNYSFNPNNSNNLNNSNNDFTQTKSSLDLVKNYISDSPYGESDKKSSKTYEEEIDDEKIVLLDKIDEIKKRLVKKNINIDNVPIITYDSSLPEIKYTYRLLQVKNNRDLNINFTNNMVKISISLLEKVFDGQKTYFGITPNIVGYSKIAQITLQDLNIEAEQLSGEIFNRQNTNPAFKIAAAIIPGMIYYSTRNNQFMQPNNNTEKKPNMDELISEIDNL